MANNRSQRQKSDSTQREGSLFKDTVIDIIFDKKMFRISIVSSFLKLSPFSGDVKGYEIRLDPIESNTDDFPVDSTVTANIPIPSPRRSILREPRRRSVHFEGEDIS